jgi:hypothetical protein
MQIMPERESEPVQGEEASGTTTRGADTVTAPATPLCPSCRQELTRTPGTVAGTIFVCTSCQRGYAQNASGLDLREVQRQTRVKYRTYAATATEREIQASIVQGLRLLGFIVFQTGTYRADLSGNDPGLADLIVCNPKRGNVWQFLECKRVGGRVRPAQAALVAAGVSSIVRNLDEALEVLEGEPKP